MLTAKTKPLNQLTLWAQQAQYKVCQWLDLASGGAARNVFTATVNITRKGISGGMNDNTESGHNVATKGDSAKTDARTERPPTTFIWIPLKLVSPGTIFSRTFGPMCSHQQAKAHVAMKEIGACQRL